jgi:hypothetical protein
MKPYPRRTPSSQSLIKRLIALVGREIGQLEARYDAREAAAERGEIGDKPSGPRRPRDRRPSLPKR